LLAGSGCQVAAIEAAHHLTDPNALQPGEVLRFPPAPPFALTVQPSEGPAGTAFELRRTGVPPTATVTFSIAADGHAAYTGPPHTPAPDGSVSATYQTWPSDPTGAYVVLAHASNGKGAFATFLSTSRRRPPSRRPDTPASPAARGGEISAACPG
jgi:hypothetical protein